MMDDGPMMIDDDTDDDLHYFGLQFSMWQPNSQLPATRLFSNGRYPINRFWRFQRLHTRYILPSKRGIYTYIYIYIIPTTRAPKTSIIHWSTKNLWLSFFHPTFLFGASKNGSCLEAESGVSKDGSEGWFENGKLGSRGGPQDDGRAHHQDAILHV